MRGWATCAWTATGFSDTDWRITRGGPCLGEHNEEVLSRLLGLDPDEVARLEEEGVL